MSYSIADKYKEAADFALNCAREKWGENSQFGYFEVEFTFDSISYEIDGVSVYRDNGNSHIPVLAIAELNSKSKMTVLKKAIQEAIIEFEFGACSFGLYGSLENYFKANN